MDEFDTNRLTTRLIRRLAEEFPGLFLPAALRQLNSNVRSNALRYLSTVVLRQEGIFDVLTSATQSNTAQDHGVNLFKKVPRRSDPSFDVKLAERLPNRRETNLSDALDAACMPRERWTFSTRPRTDAGTVADSRCTCRPIRDNRISAKATLFVGRRIQNPAWTRKQLAQLDHRVRANAVESIWGVDLPSAVSLLEDCASDMDNRVSGNSLMGLHLLGRTEVERRVFALADAAKYEFRSTAAWIMGKMAGSENLHRLTCLVKDDHPQVRSMALRSLLEIRRAESKTPQAIADRASPKRPHENAAKVIEDALEAIHAEQKAEPAQTNIEVRLDGSAFKVR